MTVELPDRGFVFWPVGCGDSTTIKVNDEVILQIDIQHHESAESDNEPYHPVVDTLVDEVLPEIDGEKYLAVFALTHPDKDHCKGFAELLENCKIGELWFTPRIIREYDSDDELSEDAQKFCEEANRRIELNNNGTEAESGDRIRIIGNDDILEEDEYKDIPDKLKSRPGESTTVLDGVDLDGSFRAFFHAPFGDDSDGSERNKTSLALQITLAEGEEVGRLMLFGDLDYPPLKRIFDYSNDDDKAWDVFLAPHHCSKSAMYFQEEGDNEPVLKQDILDLIEEAAGEQGWVVSSSTKVPTSNKSGDNPPHAIAKEHYEEIAPSGFLCTGDEESSDDPIAFEVTSNGMSLFGGEVDSGKSEAAEAIKDARGGSESTGTTVSFGRR